MSKTTTEFLASVKRRITMPAQQSLLSDPAILSLGDDCIASYIAPMLVTTMQDYFVYVVDVPLVSGQSSYDIPYRAMGRTLRDLKAIITSNPDNVRNMVKISLEDAHLFRTNVGTSSPYGFHFQGDKIVVVPEPTDATNSLRIFFELPPNKMIEVGDAGLITGISGGDITVSSTPSSFSTSSLTDFIAGRQGNATRSFDIAPTNIAGNIITYAIADVPSTLVVGDYIALAEQTPVLQIPDSCFPWLVTKTGRRVLNAIGDFEGYRALDDDDKDEELRLSKILQPRITGEQTKIVNRYGLARQGRSIYGRRILF